MMNLPLMRVHADGLRAHGVTAVVAAEASLQATPYHSYCDACMYYVYLCVRISIYTWIWLYI